MHWDRSLILFVCVIHDLNMKNRGFQEFFLVVKRSTVPVKSTEFGWDRKGFSACNDECMLWIGT
jgi:hypothetical protein